MKFTQNKFNGGEFSKEMVARYDIPQYNSACKTLLNFTPTLQGGVKRRKGFVYKYTTKFPTQKSRLIKFIFNEIDSFVLEFGNNYIRFIKGETQVTSGGSPYEISSPYSPSQLDALKYKQIGDLIYITHPNVPPQKLTRIADNNWTLSAVNFEYGPVEKENSNKSITAYVSSGTHTEGGSCVITFSSNVLVSAHIGGVFKFVKSNNPYFAKCTAVSSGTVGSFTAIDDLSAIVNSGNATYQWSTPAWTSVNGYPSCLTFHEQRLVFAGSLKYPLTIWGSVSGGNFENFEAGSNADDAYVFELAGQINKIQWIKSDNLYIACGTLGGIGFIGTSNQSALTPTNVNARLSSSYGSANVEPVLINDLLVYASSNGKAFLELQYDDTLLRYKATDISKQNTSILNNITLLEQAEQPDLCVYGVTDGKIGAIMRDLNNQTLAMFRLETNGLIESMTIIPTVDDDIIWAIVNRSGQRYIEKINNSTNEIFVDSAIIYTGDATRTITGLTHLAGKTVLLSSKVASGWFFVGEYTVTSGGVLTIPNSKETFTYACVGLKYDSIVETMPPIIQTKTVLTYGQKMRIVNAKVTLQETAVFKAGVGDNVEVYQKPVNAYNTAPIKYGVTYPEMKKILIESIIDELPTFKIIADSCFDAIIHSIQLELKLELE